MEPTSLYGLHKVAIKIARRILLREREVRLQIVPAETLNPFNLVPIKREQCYQVNMSLRLFIFDELDQ